jgi:H2-forming N5,N10-methylenetetrahydromethanopterin dehydrogenase-like enzyme
MSESYDNVEYSAAMDEGRAATEELVASVVDLLNEGEDARAVHAELIASFADEPQVILAAILAGTIMVMATDRVTAEAVEDLDSLMRGDE